MCYFLILFFFFTWRTDLHLILKQLVTLVGYQFTYQLAAQRVLVINIILHGIRI